jgi:hypothetical protein
VIFVRYPLSAISSRGFAARWSVARRDATRRRWKQAAESRELTDER